MKKVANASRMLAIFLSIKLLCMGLLQAQETLLTIEPTKDQPRNSEGDIIELKDGRLCLIYTRFTGGTSDHATADLAMRTSPDRGKTWSGDKIVIRREGGNNVMSVSLLRLADGRIALFYLRKRSLEDCRPIMRVSSDECASFSEPEVCIRDAIGDGVPQGPCASGVLCRRQARWRFEPAQGGLALETTLIRRGGGWTGTTV